MLLRRLAVGGMAEVYVAKATGLGGFEKLVALKLIHPRYSEDPHFVQLLVEEAKISVVLTHVNVGQIFDLGHINDSYFIVMEYIDGPDCYRLMRETSAQGVQLPIDLCVHIASEVCQGLDYAHRRTDFSGAPLAIVHRDVSPQNILLSRAGEVKIVDFGIAKAALRSGQTEAGVIKGKYQYMSPEQAWADQVDRRSDIFSLGVVLYEMLTGELLYQEEGVPELLDRARKADIPPPETKRRDIPPALSGLVMKALAALPEQRYDTAIEMSECLSDFLFRYSPSTGSAQLAEFLTHILDAERAVAERGARTSTDSLSPMTRDDFTHERSQSVIFKPRTGDAGDGSVTREALCGSGATRRLAAEEGGERVEPTAAQHSPADDDSSTRAVQQVAPDFDEEEDTWAVAENLSTNAAPSDSPAPLGGGRATPASQRGHNARAGSVGSTADEVAQVSRVRADEAEGRSSTARRHYLSWMIVGVLITTSCLFAATLITRANRSELQVVTVPQGAQMKLNGVLLPERTPAKELRLSGGAAQTYRLDIFLPGYEPVTRLFRARAGKTRFIEVLRLISATLRIDSDPPQAQIWVNGRHRGVAPVTVQNLEVGATVHVEALLPDEGRERRIIRIASDNLQPKVLLRFGRPASSEPADPGQTPADSN